MLFWNTIAGLGFVVVLGLYYITFIEGHYLRWYERVAIFLIASGILYLCLKLIEIT